MEHRLSELMREFEETQKTTVKDEKGSETTDKATVEKMSDLSQKLSLLVIKEIKEAGLATSSIPMFMNLVIADTLPQVLIPMMLSSGPERIQNFADTMKLSSDATNTMVQGLVDNMKNDPSMAMAREIYGQMKKDMGE